MMSDVLLVLLIGAFFAIALVYVVACERLSGGA
jgi:hypothetical protein